MARVHVTPGICGVIVIGLYIQGSFSIRRDIDKYARISFDFSYELETIGNSLERETLCLWSIAHIIRSLNSIGSFKNQYQYFF